MSKGIEWCEGREREPAILSLSPSLSLSVPGTNFIRLIPDTTVPEGGGVRRVVFCSGKVYYELVKQREMADLTDSVAISRLEQVRP